MPSVASESKGLRLARYLKEFAGLRSSTIYDVAKYESVLWFGDMPQEPQCRSPAWTDEFDPGDAWLEVRKQQFARPPTPPEIILPWIDQQGLTRASADIPLLRSSILAPDLNANTGQDEEAPLIELRINDYPDVISSYEHFRLAWQAWSSEYRRREVIQKVYAELFRLHTQVQKQGEIFELVLGLGLLAWPNSNRKGASIRRHLITARVDLHFDPATGVIRLEGAADGVQLQIEDDMLEAELRPERSYYASVEDQLTAIDNDIWDRARMFTAIKSWAEALHADSQWSSALRPENSVDDKPSVTFAPAIILRKRTQRGMARIYNTIIDQLSTNSQEIPTGWGSLVDDSDDHDHAEPVPKSGDSAHPRPPNTQEIYFPLPANREQRRIVEGISQRRGVLVQGPPGTGKSHTIANLVCHLLATDKRVLITAETGRALRVLKDKLPKQIQPLCVSLLGQSGDAFAELNSSVQEITRLYDTWNPGAYDERLADIDQELATKRRSVARLDTELMSLREAETSSHSLMNGAYQGTASAIAERVAKERERFGWLQLPREAGDDPVLTGSDLLEWARIRRSYRDEQITAAKRRIVDIAILPAPEAFAAAATAEGEARRDFQEFASLHSHPAFSLIAAIDSSKRASVDRALRLLSDRRRDLLRRGYHWIAGVLAEALGGRLASSQALHDQSRTLIGQVERLRDTLSASTISIPSDLDARQVRVDAAVLIDHLQAGGKWTKYGFMTPGAIKECVYLRECVLVDGRPAETTERLVLVCNYIDFYSALSDLERLWPHQSGLPPAPNVQIRLEAIKEEVATLRMALGYVQGCQNFVQYVNGISSGVAAPNWLNTDAETWLEIVRAAQIGERLRLATDEVTRCLGSIKRVRDLYNDTHPVIANLIQTIEQRNISAYSEAYHDLARIEQTRKDQARRQATETGLENVAPGLIHAVADSITDSAWDERFSQWKQAWHWAIADNWLRKRSDILYQEQLWQQRQVTSEHIAELLAESAALRAWTYFFNRLHPREAAALKGWREAVRAMGKGTGRSARLERLRREARQYMDQCRETIPVWIMPRYLVAEMVTPAPNRYDVVIVDEASQLGIDSLFLFYIARKMIVVGDDQQISPYGIGIADQAIADLQHHFLDGIPHRHAMSAQSSLYANAKIRFGQNIVLREHFRCMPEIIQFSNDLCYAPNGTPLDPLRAYPPNRLCPLVVRHVEDGYRTGSSENAVNEPEANAVVDQIVACINDARYAGCTMGVISLQGETQAKLIEHKLLETLEPEIIEARRLICGDAYAFQGDERNIIFLSMVAAPNERIGALTIELARQRFNVAGSRAQDQLWLFHSATLNVLSPLCMRHRLLSYMLSPTRQVSPNNITRFDSKFEQDVFQLISDKGFHVRTQVCVGDPTNHRYRIDLVVEGMQGRLAVECDGDQWHGADRYELDMARQRDLERAGWQFVRIRGGDFYRDRGKAVEPLWAELDRLGIKPGGIDESATEPPPPASRQPHGPQEKEDEGFSPAETMHPKPKDYESESSLEGASPDHHDRFSADVDKEGPTFGGNALVDAPQTDNGSQFWRSKAGRSQSGLSTADPTGQISTSGTSLLPEYPTYQGIAGPDPRTASKHTIADGLCNIIEVEGPMLAKRAYDIYLRGCGIQRLGGELKSTMNKALMDSIRQGRIVSENEPDERGLLFSTVRIKGTDPIKHRRRGPRTFEEIPPGELRFVGQQVLKTRDLEAFSDEHLRAILDIFDLKRLTTQVGTTLLEILERQDVRVDSLS